jgi:ABC-2 type transport system permease protein
MTQNARLVFKGLLFLTKRNATSSWFLMLVLFQPLIFATIAFYMFKSGGREGTLLYAALGAGMMGIWSATLFGSGGLIQWWRWEGTLELAVGAPPPFFFVLLPAALSNSFIGAYALAATLLWGRLAYAIPLHFEHPLGFAVALLATVLSLGLMGLLLASSFVLYRHANALMNLLEYPVWVATGLIFPIALLPTWAQPISWPLAPRWGIDSIRDTALGGSGFWWEIGLTVLLGLAYAVGAFLFLRLFERLARDRATLALT